MKSRRPTVGIITVLAAEADAMRKLINRPRQITLNKDHDPATYTLGTMPSYKHRPHRVVMVEIPEPGNAMAAQACTSLINSFPTVKHVIVVGTAAGIPARGVQYGDIVVATKGALEYDLVDAVRNRTEIRGAIPAPSRTLFRTAKLLESEAFEGKRPWQDLIDGLLSEHPGSYDPPTDSAKAQVYLGMIGSGNTAFSSVEMRDQQAARHNDLLAFDMETAGVGKAAVDAGSEWFSVRGISDYGDENRTKCWRAYASLVAASYTRALLGRCPGRRSEFRIWWWASGISAITMAAVIIIPALTSSSADPIQITDQLVLHDAQGLQNGMSAYTDVPKPTERRHLDIVVKVENPSQVGDCAHSAGVDLKPIIDGREREVLTGQRPGDELRIDLAGTQNTAKVVLTVHLPDASCRVNLSVTKAVLEN